MSTAAKYIFMVVMFLCIVALFAYIFRGCQQKPPDHSGDKKSVDSTLQIVSSHDSASKIKIDSINGIVLSLQKAKDSLSNLVKETKIDIREKGKDIQGLIDELNNSESEKDTLRTLKNCDSLKDQFVSAKGLVGRYIYENDSLVRLNGQIIANKDSIIGRVSAMFTETNQALFSTSLKYNNLYVDYLKAGKSASKRFGVGPQLTVTYINGNFTVAPGVGLHYSLFKF